MTEESGDGVEDPMGLAGSPEWWDGLDWVLPLCGALVLLVGGLTAGVRMIGWVVTWSRRLTEFLEDWRGEPARPGHPRRAGVPERLAEIERRMHVIESQVTPNGGESMADGVVRIEHKLDEEKLGGDRDRRSRK